MKKIDCMSKRDCLTNSFSLCFCFQKLFYKNQKNLEWKKNGEPQRRRTTNTLADVKHFACIHSVHFEERFFHRTFGIQNRFQGTEKKIIDTINHFQQKNNNNKIWSEFRWIYICYFDCNDDHDDDDIMLLYARFTTVFQNKKNAGQN